MTGGVDKEKTCLGCPDRSVEPNCHTTCPGYLKRKERFDVARQRRIENVEMRHDLARRTARLWMRRVNK